MRNNNIEAIYSAAIFSVINIAYLLFHFSWWGCIPAALTVGYCFLCAALGDKDEKVNHTILDTIGMYVGSLFVDMMLINLCVYGLEKATFPSTGAFIGAVFLLVGEIVVLICCMVKWYSVFFRIVRYVVLLGATVGCSYIFIAWKDASVLFALLLMMAVCLVIELLVCKFSKGVAGFAWLMVLFVLFNVANFLYPEFSIGMVNWVMNLSYAIRLQWYKVVILSVLALAGVVETILLKRKELASFADTRLYLMLLMSGIFAWVLSSFKTQYNFIFLALFFIANVVFLDFIKTEDRNLYLFDLPFSQGNLVYVLTLAVLTGFPVAFYCGVILQYFVLAATALFVIIVCSKEAPESDDGAAVRPCLRWPFWQLLLTFLAIYAAVVVTLKCRTFSGYVLILAVYALATLALLILNLQNRAQHKNHYLLRAIVAIPVALILLFAVDQSMVKVSYRVDNAVSSSEELDPDSVGETGDLIVTVSSKEKDAHFAKVYGYWAGDKETVIELTPAEENRLPLRSDCLCVVCEDESGLIHTDRHWFFPEADAVQEFVGRMRPQRFPALFSANEKAAE